MKRILCALLSALLLLTLTACGGKKPAEDPTADGTAVIYQPFLSLQDGSLAVPEDGTVYDFTVYPEGFVRETTA